MKTLRKEVEAKKYGLGLSFFAGLFIGALSPAALATDAMTLANTTTNTDSNGDGKSDGNVVTFHRDANLQTKFNTHVASANLRGSLADAECIDAVGEACSSVPYFLGGNVDLNVTQLSENITVLATNDASATGVTSTSAEGRAPDGVENLCQSVPMAFGCQPGDEEMLKSARESMEDAINTGKPLLADGKDPKSFLGTIDNFISKFDEVKARIGAGFVSSLKTIGLNVFGGGDDGKKENSPLYTFEDYNRNNLDNASLATAGRKAWVGPQSLAEMSAQVEAMNGLEVIDRKNGRPLTLWQRATRRYQSFDLSRAYTLAKSEGTRGQILSKRAPASTTPVK
jgi:hypothetical protein